MVSWSLDRAATFVASIAERAHAAGWLVAMYGSTVTRGAGRDLDLIFVPWREGADSEGIAAVLGVGTVLADYHEAARDRSLGMAFFVDGRIVDVLVVPRVDERDVV